MSTTDLVRDLNDLLQLEYDAIGAYEVAMDELGNGEHAEHLELFRRHHERHVQELNRQIQSLGGIPTNEPHAMGPLNQALQGLGALRGELGTLMAFQTNELHVRARYADCVARAIHWPPAARGLVERHAVDEERHVRWVTAALLAKGENPPSDLSSAVEDELADRRRRSLLALAGIGFVVGLLVGRIVR